MTDHPFLKDLLAWRGWPPHRSSRRPGDRGVTIEYSSRVLMVGGAGLALWLAMALRSLLLPSAVDSPALTLAFLGCALLHGALIVRYWRVRYRLEPDGLHYRTLLGRNRSILWNDVARVRYSSWRRHFVIEGKRGETVAVSTMMTSLADFSCAALKCVPRARMDAKTFRLLKSAAAGLIPHIWQ